ncbi:MAG: 30S ribosomal protein S9 [Chloroflexi bacterium]|nr:MAG: 30S ribosomal protein S9 [Chloroflexota bacterium]
MEERYFYGTGRRKTAVARVRLYPDGGGVLVNEKSFEEFFPTERLRATVLQPLQLTGNLEKFRVVAKVEGGGITGQAEAVRHGISRALVQADPNLKLLLRDHGLLTRDPRVKERQKYGFRRARKRKQYRKR